MDRDSRLRRGMAVCMCKGKRDFYRCPVVQASRKGASISSHPKRRVRRCRKRAGSRISFHPLLLDSLVGAVTVTYMLPIGTCGYFSRSMGDHWHPNHMAVASSKTLPRKPGNVPHSTRLTKGILWITLLIRKHSGMVMSTAMPHLSSGYSATTWKTEAKPTNTGAWMR